MLKLLPLLLKNNQPNLFHNQLRDMLDSKYSLVSLANTIQWEHFNESFSRDTTVKKENQLSHTLNGQTADFKTAREPL